MREVLQSRATFNEVKPVKVTPGIIEEQKPKRSRQMEGEGVIRLLPLCDGRGSAGHNALHRLKLKSYFACYPATLKKRSAMSRMLGFIAIALKSHA